MLQERTRRSTDHIGRGSFDPAVQERSAALAIIHLRSAASNLDDASYRLGLDDGSAGCPGFAQELIDNARADLTAALVTLGSSTP